MGETFTNELLLSKFETGDNPGALKLNANLDKIDKAVMGHGDDLPANYTVGKLFLQVKAVGRGTIYRNEGTFSIPVWTNLLDVSNLAVADIAGLAATLATLAKRTYVFTVPDALTTTDNDLIPWLFGVGQPITELLALVKTAPTGANIIIEFFIGTISTGVLGASVGTVTITAGNYSGTTTLGAPFTPGTDKFLAMQINQKGSTIAGANLTAIAR